MHSHATVTQPVHVTSYLSENWLALTRGDLDNKMGFFFILI
jgi:hypothetical protein